MRLHLTLLQALNEYCTMILLHHAATHPPPLSPLLFSAQTSYIERCRNHDGVEILKFHYIKALSYIRSYRLPSNRSVAQVLTNPFRLIIMNCSFVTLPLHGNTIINMTSNPTVRMLAIARWLPRLGLRLQAFQFSCLSASVSPPY